MTDEQADQLIALAERIAVALEAPESRVTPLPPRPGRRIPPNLQAAIDEFVDQKLDERVDSSVLIPVVAPDS
jgi:hypothetical protein